MKSQNIMVFFYFSMQRDRNQIGKECVRVCVCFCQSHVRTYMHVLRAHVFNRIYRKQDVSVCTSGSCRHDYVPERDVEEGFTAPYLWLIYLSSWRDTSHYTRESQILNEYRSEATHSAKDSVFCALHSLYIHVKDREKK